MSHISKKMTLDEAIRTDPKYEKLYDRMDKLKNYIENPPKIQESQVSGTYLIFKKSWDKYLKAKKENDKKELSRWDAERIQTWQETLKENEPKKDDKAKMEKLQGKIAKAKIDLEKVKIDMFKRQEFIEKKFVELTFDENSLVITRVTDEDADYMNNPESLGMPDVMRFADRHYNIKIEFSFQYGKYFGRSPHRDGTATHFHLEWLKSQNNKFKGRAPAGYTTALFCHLLKKIIQKKIVDPNKTVFSVQPVDLTGKWYGLPVSAYPESEQRFKTGARKGELKTSNEMDSNFELKEKVYYPMGFQKIPKKTKDDKEELEQDDYGGNIRIYRMLRKSNLQSTANNIMEWCDNKFRGKPKLIKRIKRASDPSEEDRLDAQDY